MRCPFTPAFLLIVSLSGVLPAGPTEAFGAGAGAPSTGSGPTTAGDTVLPLIFEANAGQFPPDVRFATRDGSAALVAIPRGVALRLTGASRPAAPLEGVSLSWDGASAVPDLTGEGALRHGVTVIAGRDPARWRPALPAFRRVRWRQAYPGIDIVFYGRGRTVEYDVIVAPGADPSRIALRFTGVDRMRVDSAGDLEIDTPGGPLVQRVPRVYQRDGTRVREVAARHRVREDDLVGFDLAPFDRAVPLVVDPVLTWATLFGAGGYDDVRGVALDGAGNTHVLVSTSAKAPPAQVAIGAATDDSKLLIVTLSPQGEEVLGSTWISGNRQVNPTALVVDSLGRASVTGSTGATDFPLVAPWQSACRQSVADSASCADGFVLRLDATGTHLEQSTYLGGSGWDLPLALALTPAGHLVVAGVTESTDFPTVAAHQPEKATCPTCEIGQDDVFVTLFSSDGTALVFSTYLGGIDDEYLRAVAVDSQGSVYVSGSLSGTGFPASQAVAIGPQPATGQGFLAKFSSTGTLTYASRLEGLEHPLVAVEPAAMPHVTGQAAMGPEGPERSPLVVRLASDGLTVLSSARYGGTNASPAAIALDALNREYVVGWTDTADVPLQEAIAAHRDYSLWRSIDGGERYAQAGTGLTDRVNALAFDPRHPQVVYAGTIGSGVFYSADGGVTWTSRTAGIGDQVVTRLAVDRFWCGVYAIAGAIDGAAGNRLYRSSSGAGNWTPAGEGLSGTLWSVAPDPHWSGVVHVGTDVGLFTSADGGATWERSPTAPERVFTVVPDPAHAGTMFLVSGQFDVAGVYRTTDGGLTWRRVYATGSRTGAASVTSLVIAPGSGSRLFLATDRGGFARSDDGGTTWSSLPAPLASNRLVATSPSTVYASASDVSHDAGATWERIGAGLPSGGGAVVPQPGSPSTLLATEYVTPPGFLVVLDPLAGAPLLSSYSPGISTPQRLAVGPEGELIVAGSAEATAFPATTRFGEIDGSSIFVARIDRDADADGDGLPGTWEQMVGLDPVTADADDDPDGDGATNGDEYAAGTHPRGLFTQYFAEGASNTFFDTTLALVNADDARTAHVWLRFLSGGGEIGHHGLAIPPLTHRTVDLRRAAGLSDAEFATLVESDVDVAVDRIMSWNARAYGAHGESAQPGPASTWYFAEGATHSGFQLFYLLENPNAVDASVEASYLTGDGRELTETYVVRARTRLTVWANWVPGLGRTDVAAVFVTPPATPVLVERAMYLDAGGQAFGAGHAAAGVPEPATQWHFAEGATGSYFDLFLLLANPTTADADVDVSYLLPSGPAIVRRYAVPARQRVTVWVDIADPLLADTAVAMSVVSLGGPVVAERAMWWPGPTAATWYEGHCAFGTPAPATRWVVASGITGGTRHAETYVLLGNPAATPVTVRATLLFEDGVRAEQLIEVGPRSRANITASRDPWTSSSPAVAERLATGARFGMVIESVDVPPTPFVAETSVYWDAAGSDGRSRFWAAGTSSRATPRE